MSKSSSKLHDFLEFLTKRYDYEWEVKEMVVRKFKHEKYSNLI